MPNTPGYSGKPLSQKLGLKPGMQAALYAAPDTYPDWTADAVDINWQPWPATHLDFIHAFFTRKVNFEAEMPLFQAAIVPNGMIWISWPKKSAGVPTDLLEDNIRAYALAHGLVDVKVCAVSEVWSGLKLVIPVKLRVKK